MPMKRTHGGPYSVAGRPLRAVWCLHSSSAQGPSQRLTSGAQKCSLHLQTAVDMLVALLRFVDVLIVDLVLAAHDDVLVGNGFIQVLPGKDGTAFHEEPVLVQVSE